MDLQCPLRKQEIEGWLVKSRASLTKTCLALLIIVEMRKITASWDNKGKTSRVTPNMKIEKGKRNSITIYKKKKVIRLMNLSWTIKSLQSITRGRKNKNRAKAQEAKRKSKSRIEHKHQQIERRLSKSLIRQKRITL